jgi:hypothetical protein
MAAAQGHTKCLKALFEKGAERSVVDNQGNKLLHTAAATCTCWSFWDTDIEFDRPTWEAPQDIIAKKKRQMLLGEKADASEPCPFGCVNAHPFKDCSLFKAYQLIAKKCKKQIGDKNHLGKTPGKYVAT